ncbi:hypothetical protein PND92_01290 [Faecalicoccus pleomorphus]|uniref:hypothetical protein n=1 Tax=Faecalicoccus pleomorphus TaxID=1323 RepID=UPI00232B3B2F|nr:hypothetical protein [Faecalicoccus pleomorphus]MDB7988050.1 hypothetical protein [Faecalicoccus pleomorphus]MDB7992400.1 hypothetical protein [Faecalicoccus pleomorphus]
MTARKSKDEISRLLDSFQEEEVLEEKMEGFTAQKRRQDRMQRASRQTVEPEPVQNETNDTIVLRPEPKKTESAGTTVMFDPEKIEEEDTDTNKTVVINDNEIQSLLDEDKPPKLRREVVSHGGSSHRKEPMPHKKPTKKKGLSPAAIVGIVVAALMVVGILGFGVYTLMNSGKEDKTEEVTKKQKRAYDSIVDWLDSLTGDDYDGIEDWEEDYDSLTKEQKKKLNDYFEKITGSTFDELLAKAKSDSKKDSSNNNAKIAELKAQLKSLESQLSDAQSDLNDANSRLSSAQSDYDNWNNKLSTWQNTNAQLKQKQTELSTLEARMKELQNIPADQISQEELSELTQSYKTQASLQQEVSNLQGQLNGVGDYSSIQSHVNSASSEVSQAQSDVDAAQSTIDQLTSQIQEVQNRIDALES